MTERERELEAALREIENRCHLLNEHKLGKSARYPFLLYQEVSRIQFLASYFRVKFSADALAASPEAAPRLPGAVLQANEDGTISKVEDVSDPLTAQDKSSSLADLKAMTHDNSHPMQTPYDRMVRALIERVEEVVKEMRQHGGNDECYCYSESEAWADKLEG